MSGEDEQVLVGRCYTKARRHRLVIGQVDGHRLWGGPYTVPQFVTMGAVLGLMLLSRSLWARFGLLNVVPLVAVPYAAAFTVRQFHIDGRNPFAAAVSTAGLAFAGQGGRLGGRPLRRLRPRPLLGGCTLTWRTPAQAAGGALVRVLHRPGLGAATVRPAVSSSEAVVCVPEATPAPGTVAVRGSSGGAVVSSAAALLAAKRAAARREAG